MPKFIVPTWGAPRTDQETRLLVLLVEKLGGHSVDLTPVVDGKVVDEPAKAGFSVGRNRSVRLADIAAIFAPEARNDIADALYEAIAGDNGINCAGGCGVDGACVCSPAYKAIAALRGEPDPLRDAAPDMLEAAKELVAVHGDGARYAERPGAFAKLADAIAKAEGRT